MKFRNMTAKILGVGKTAVLPDKVIEISTEEANTNAFKTFVRMGMFSEVKGVESDVVTIEAVNETATVEEAKPVAPKKTKKKSETEEDTTL